MDHRQLLNFLSVCEEKSITNAAKRCFISHQGLSKSIKLLENEFNVPLFIRTGSGIETTEFGKTLQDAIMPYINQHDKIVEIMRRLKGQNEHHVSIGMISGFYRFLPSNFFNLFMELNPDISIDIMSYSDDVYQKTMLDYKIDVGFVCAPINESVFEPLFCQQTQIGLIVGEKHPLSKRLTVKPCDLRGEQLIVLNGNRRIIDYCYRFDIKPSIYLSLAERDLACELCVSGRMVCISGPLNENFTNLLFIKIEDCDLYIDIHLVANRNKLTSIAAKKFIAYTRKQLSKSKY
jgi:DNA-binding transcriptional LysR family regulator